MTQALADIDSRYQLLRKLKAGRGNHQGYRFRSTAELDRLEARGELLHRTTRYGNDYAVETATIDQLVGIGVVPVVHMGQLAGVTAIRRHTAIAWYAVLLWCARSVALERAAERGDSDVADRAAAWDETPATSWGSHDSPLTLQSGLIVRRY
jgi:guanylate kinase